MARFLIGLSGFALGIICGLIVAGWVTIKNPELADAKKVLADAPADVAEVRQPARESKVNQRSTAKSMTAPTDSDTFASLVHALSPGSPLYDFGTMLKQRGLWHPEWSFDLNANMAHLDNCCPEFCATQVGDGKVYAIIRPEYSGYDGIWRVAILFRFGETTDDEAAAVKHLAKILVAVSNQFGLSDKETNRMDGFFSWMPVVPPKTNLIPQVPTAFVKNAPPDIRRRFNRGIAICEQSPLQRAKLGLCFADRELPAVGTELSDTCAAEMFFCPDYSSASQREAKYGDTQSGWWTFTVFRGLENGDTSTKSTEDIAGTSQYCWPRLTIDQIDEALQKNGQKKR